MSDIIEERWREYWEEYGGDDLYVPISDFFAEFSEILTFAVGGMAARDVYETLVISTDIGNSFDDFDPDNTPLEKLRGLRLCHRLIELSSYAYSTC